MKNFFLALLLFPILAFAQGKNTEQKLSIATQCFDRDLFINEIVTVHKEKIIFTGMNENNLNGSSSFVTYNTSTGTFTIGIFIPYKNIVCVVSSGNGSIVK